MIIYLSREMAKRLVILAVQHMTSVAIQRLQYSWPNTHSPRRSLTIANGMTSAESSRSATAKEIKNKFESFRRLLSVQMAVMTKILPKTLTVTKSERRTPRATSPAKPS